MGSRILYIRKPAGNPIYYPEYGLLYNWYAATDSRKISSSDDWVVPNQTQVDTLKTYVGGANSGGKMKESGYIYWQSPNTSATNEFNFNGRGNGQRSNTGVFSLLKQSSAIWTSVPTGSNAYDYGFSYSTNLFYNSYSANKKYGFSVRLLYTGSGTPTEYTGNDGKKYRVITIGTQTWLADNLAETRFRDGSIIPWYGANPANSFTNAAWAALTTAGCCAYNNTLSNVGPGFSFPT